MKHELPVARIDAVSDARRESLGMPGIALSDVPLIAWYIASLVVLEGLLSADNALVLAVMVRHLPQQQQKQALRYGLWGAFGFRLIAVLLSAMLMRFWMFKVVGGLYLTYLALAHFLGAHDSSASKLGSGDPRGTQGASRKSFWGTVLSVELADVAFSIDSILAAVGMAESLPKRYGDNWKLAIVYIGGVLGIITMRYVAGYFILLLNRFGGLATAAYLLVAWIGLKLVVGGLHTGGHFDREIPGWLFWSIMLLIVVIGLVLKPGTSGTGEPGQAGAAESLPPNSAQTRQSVDGKHESQSDITSRLGS
jgi:YkoY family integral membrane protein